MRLESAPRVAQPHGFDYELWLWEQGVQATGYVRAGPKDQPPSGWVPPGSTRWSNGASRCATPSFSAWTAALRDEVHPPAWPVVAAWSRATSGPLTGQIGTSSRHGRGAPDDFGLHITLFAWLAAALVRLLWRRSARLCLAVPAPTAAPGVWRGAGGRLCACSAAGVCRAATVTMLAVVVALRLSGRLALAAGVAAGLRCGGADWTLGAARRVLAELCGRGGVVCY